MINEELVGMIVLGLWGLSRALNERNLHDKSYEYDPSHTREEEDLDFNPILMTMKSRNWKLIVSSLWELLEERFEARLNRLRPF